MEEKIQINKKDDFRQNKHESHSNSSLHRQFVDEESLKENVESYLLELNEMGQPNINLKELLKIKNDTLLIIKLYNGSDITNNIFMVSNLPECLQTKEIDIPSFTPIPKAGPISHKFKAIPPHRIDTSIYFYYYLKNSGSFFFQIGYTKDNLTLFTQEFWIVVDPVIKIGDITIPIQNISLQTVLSKALGKLETWENYFHEASLLSTIRIV